MKLLTPEEKAFRDFNKFEEVKLTPSERCETDFRERYDKALADSDIVWDIVREESEEALRLNPDDEVAQAQMLRYRQWQSQRQPDVKKSGLTLVKPGRKMILAKTGVWVRDKVQGWLIRASGCDVGDVVPVRKKGGVIEQIKLTQRIYEGVSIFKGVRHG
jgi:hypothetical protein